MSKTYRRRRPLVTGTHAKRKVPSAPRRRDRSPRVGGGLVVGRPGNEDRGGFPWADRRSGGDDPEEGTAHMLSGIQHVSHGFAGCQPSGALIFADASARAALTAITWLSVASPTTRLMARVTAASMASACSWS